MNFNKFSAFPKTEPISSQKNTQNTNFFELLKLLPNLFSIQRTPKSEPQKTPDTTLRNNDNTKAYAEYLARHDEHVKRSREINQK